MLFPPPPPSVRYFKPKNSQGVLAKFCSECGSHLDAHAYQWITGGSGTIRACPPQNEIAANNNPNNNSHMNQSNISAINQNSTSRSQQHPNQSQISDARLNGSQYGSHHVWKHQTDVDLSLTSSGLVGDKKTVGNVPAHHRFYSNKARQAQQEQEQQQQMQQSSSSGNYDPRQTQPPIPQAHPHNQHHDENGQQQQYDENGQPQQQPQVYYDEETGEYFYYEDDLAPGQAPPQLPGNNNINNQQQQPEGFNSRQPGGKNFYLYDEAYTTPIPFGTDTDLVNPPNIPLTKGRRHIPAQDHTGPLANEEEYFSKLNQKPKMSAVRARMEQSHLEGAGGINVRQDGVRPEQEKPRTIVSHHRKDAQSNLRGVGW